jgi:uncharacterized phage protein gp47/JayE
MAELPLFLEEQTFETILQRMLDAVPPDLDKSEGNFIYDALAPVAAELAQQRDYFRYYVEQAFATKAKGEFLDYIATDYGLTRYPAVPARVELVFTGAPGIFIPAGTSAATTDGKLIFSTTADTVISESGTASVEAVCETPGTIGNVAANTLTVLATPVSGVLSVDNPAPASGGVDQESDDSLRNRILYLRRNPERGGATSDYERWALSVPGVTWAKAIDKPRGLGTVDVIIAGDITQLDALVAQVQEVVDNRRPRGIDAKVRKVQFATVAFRLTVTGIDAETARLAALDYLNSVDIGGMVVLSKLIAAVINKGALDVVVLEPAENIQLPPDVKLNPVVYVE